MKWQKMLRYRGIRMMILSLPLLLLSLVSASFIPRRPPAVLASGTVTAAQAGSGRLVIPSGVGEDVPVSLLLEWDGRPPSGLRLALDVSDPESQDKLQKKIKVKAQKSAGGWQQSLLLPLPAAALLTFQLRSAGQDAFSTRYQFIAFAKSPGQRLLRFGEMLFYPALAFVLLALVMILFPSFIKD